MTATSGRTALYRYFDTEGQPLYIGITWNPDARWKGHKHSEWAPLVATRTVQWYPSNREAVDAETAAIRAERPRFNVAQNYEPAPFTAEDWPRLRDMGRGKAVRIAALIRAEIASGRWSPNQRVPSPKILAAAVGVSLGTAASAVHSLAKEGVLYRHRAGGYFVSGAQPD